MNFFTGHGRLTKDPQVRYTQSGKAVAVFTLAIDRRRKKDTKESEADFIPCVAWEKTAEILGNNVTKGQEIVVEGRMQSRTYEKDGVKHYVVECVLSGFEFCGKKSDNQGQGQQAASLGGEYIPDSEIPF